MISLRITEIRYSLNGLTESQVQTLFELLDKEEDQIIYKRLTDLRFSLSSDDILIKGNFSIPFILTVSQTFSPPLSFKIEGDQLYKNSFELFGAKMWLGAESNIYVGNTIIPVKNLKKVIGYTYGDQFISLISTTPAGSDLRPLLITKAKGLIEAKDGEAMFIFPFHRLDFILEWVNQIINGVASFDWLSGSTNELSSHLIGSNGVLSSTINTDIMKWVNKLQTGLSIDLNVSYRRALKIIL